MALIQARLTQVSGVEAISWSELVKHWWQWALIGIILLSLLVGFLYTAFCLLRRLVQYLVKKNEPSHALIETVVNHLQRFSASCSQLSSSTSLEKVERLKPMSLGIYLGPFESPATEHVVKLFSNTDMVILDPLQLNVSATLDDVCGISGGPSHITGRLDLAILLKNPTHTRKLEAYLIPSVDRIMSTVFSHFRALNGCNNGFNGILLAGWQIFPVPILNQLGAVLNSHGLDVYLETAAPDFLEDSKVLGAGSIAGLVIRNGLIHPNGERRDCFDMESLRVTVKAFVSQACLRNFTVLIWETLHDDVVPSNAVLRRTYTWCNFNSALLWIGSNKALFDASVNAVKFEPLSAFDWLKEHRVMELHGLWRNNQTSECLNQRHSSFQQANSLLPSLNAAQRPTYCEHDSLASISCSAVASSEASDWFILKDAALADPICFSPNGMSYDGIGCFPLGVDVTIDDFQEICYSQRNIRKLDLLDAVPASTLQSYGTVFQQFIADFESSAGPRHSSLLSGQDEIRELSNLLVHATEESTEGIRVFIGLHSSLQRTSEKQFWAVYNVHNSDLTDIYLSKNAHDALGTILHTFLSCRGFTRRQCFTAEFIFARWNDTLVEPHGIPQRTVQDLSQLSPEDRIVLLQQLTLSPETEDDIFLAGVKSALSEQLIDQPSMHQLKELNTSAYLDGTVDKADLVASRLRWHCQQNQPHPSLAAAVTLFSEVEATIFRALKERNSDELHVLTDALDAFLSRSCTDALGDIFALSVFCTMRKIAFEEVYIEVTDRNPLFNDQSDQAAAFAELFALGSRCESYFDMTPSRFGEVMSKKYRAHYSQVNHQPPAIKESNFALSSAYAEAQIDVDPDYKASEMPAYQRFTFMSVFAIPALIDIIMLTTTGHGLWLSSYMSRTEQHSATVALMLSLILSGAFGTWISCGGTYYLNSMAFSAMNYFVVTRLLAGFAFTLIVAVVGFVAFACTTHHVQAGTVFFLYLVCLTTYLCLLAALANFQFTGTTFQSGRTIIIICIPVLFISPLTAIFVSFHDIDIYLTVLYTFTILLAFGVRHTGSQWTTWYQKIILLDDLTLKDWYLDKVSSTAKKDLLEISEPAILKLARQALFHDVLLERQKHFFTRRTKDPLVTQLAGSLQATEFLMDWYSRYSGVPKPIPFSSAWNIQTKAALDSIQKSQLGIRFHNGFIHWRQAGDEIGCTILYFVIALLDKWILLITGGALTGLLSSSNGLRMPVGFGLAYFLVGAVLLDTNAYKLHALAAQDKEKVVPSEDDIPRAMKAKSQARKTLYWKTLRTYLVWHVWGLASITAVIWVFASKPVPPTPRSPLDPNPLPPPPPPEPTMVFLSYVVAYTGLLWFQYTKVFSGPHALKPLLVGLCVGLPVGFILHHEQPNHISPYADIIALGSATWTAAILSLWAGKIVGGPVETKLGSLKSSFHAYSAPGPDQAWSQPELQSLHDKLTSLSDGERFPVDPDSDFGRHVKVILRQWRYTKLPELADQAFPDAEKLLELTEKLFQEGSVNVELVSVDHLIKHDRAMRAVSSDNEGNIRLLVGCETKYVAQNQDPLPGFYQDVGELLIQVVAELFLGYSTRDAVLAQNLWADTTANTSVLERQLRNCSKVSDASKLISHLRQQLLRDLCLGFECDIEWESLPVDIRKYLVDRCLGHSALLSDDQIQFLSNKLNVPADLRFDTFLARCNYAALAGTLSISRASAWVSGDQSQRYHMYQIPMSSLSILNLFARTTPTAPPSLSDKIRKYCGFIYHQIGVGCKFFSVAFVADPEYAREVKCTFSYGPPVTQSMTRIFYTSIWLWSKAIQTLLMPVFLLHHRDSVVTLWKNIQGMEVSFKRRRIIIRNLDGIYTAFIHSVDEDTFRLLQFRGDHHSQPENEDDLCSINMYSKKDMALLRRVELNHGHTINDYVYEYRNTVELARKRLSKSDNVTAPMTRKGIAGQNNLQDVNYNSKGQIDSGSWMKDGNLIRFQYHYQKSSRFQGVLLRAEFVLPHMSCTVSWCAPPRRHPERLDSWIPHSQVTECTFVIGAEVYESKYFYDHKFHPTILTTQNGQRVDTPDFILYDHLDILKKPKHVLFLDDNPLFSFTSIKSHAITRWLGLCTRKYPVSTSQARSWLWKAWKDDPGFDGVVVRWLDERLLRRDPILRPYWRKRDSGYLEAAEAYLDEHRDAVMGSVDLDNTISSWTPLAMKINDLYSFGQGGDACSRTRSNAIREEEDDEAALHVIAVDTGTWPNEAGGVTACRSDVINNLRTIKWHMVAEAANDFGIPKRQIERNVHSLKVIPIWGLDLMTPTHGLFANRLDSELDHITTHTTLLDIEHTFVPILAAMISGARALDFTISDIKQVTRALVNLNAYFEGGRHWGAVWKSDVVKSVWRRLWLSKLESNTLPSSQWLKAELPTLGQLDQGLELWSRYLFIYSIPIPDKMPAVFQASHHSVSASYGIVCKIKRGCTLQIWDHAISWRETNLFLSSALCPLSPFTRNSLLGLMKMTSLLTLHHADTILPCADFFNPNWEVEIGTSQGKIEHRSTFRRKIDPVVNGITHMERFNPVQELKTKHPTVTMLSHVWFAKDIKTALLAADIIINQWGFKDYHLDIYGTLDKSPAYTTNCQEIIATKSLRYNVKLRGEADPIDVLQKTWVFLNSSISEGLPLALGEAALTGAPVVCTDVGASLRVLTNPEDGSCFSEVVAPNDAHAMARAQIKILALLEEWSQYADDTVSSQYTYDASFPENPTVEDVARITRRMYEQTDARRALGMKSRAIVQKSFSGDRYLREHEQMLWVGKARHDMARATSSRPTTLLPAPRPVKLANVTSQPAQSGFSSAVIATDNSLPSLAYGTSVSRPSISTDYTGVTGLPARIVEQEWIKRPQRVMVKIIDVPGRSSPDNSMGEMNDDGLMV